MSYAFPHFHPNPGWSAPKSTDTNDEPNDNFNISITDTVGKHCILELYDCDCARLDDETFLRFAITNAAVRAGATLLHLITHHFQPHGVTGLALLAESHISIHTWPESGYAGAEARGITPLQGTRTKSWDVKAKEMGGACRRATKSEALEYASGTCG